MSSIAVATGPVTRRSPHRLALELAIPTLSVAIALVDFRTKIGLTIWVFHLVPLALTLYTWRPALPLVIAVVSIVFTIADYFLSPAGTSLALSQINRACGGLVFIAVGVVGLQHIRGKLALRAQDWARAAHNAIALAVQGEQTTAEIARNVLDVLGDRFEAPIGALHVRDGGRLRRVGGRALPPDAPTDAPLDAGPLGEAVRRRAVVQLSPAPAGYLPLRSAIGAGSPREVVVIPAAVDGEVLAVLELGFLRALDPIDREVLGRVAEPIAIALRSAEYRGKLQALLEETQRQAEELETQSEELRVSNEGLEEQASALRQAIAAQERAQVELEESNANLEEQTTLLEQQQAELLAAQDELERRGADLERASRYKSEFLANMSHELRTPLNSLLILARILADNPAGNLDAEQVSYAESIASAGDDLLLLINDILDLAKIEAGKLEARPGTVVVARLRDALLRSFEPMAKNKGIGLTIELGDGLPETFTTDEGRALQILRNLVGNAIKFTDKGGVTVRIERRGERLVVAVTDSGIGIPADKQALVFEAFRQVDGNANRRFGGTGLGLTISRDLARMLGGDVAVTRSEPGVGSTFELALPLAGPPPAAAAAVRSSLAAGPDAAPPPPAPSASARRRATAVAPAVRPAVADDRDAPGDKRRMLIVEDDPSFAGILVGLVRERGFHALVAATAEEAMALAEERLPDGVLLDMQLPDHSGLTVLERIKRSPVTRHIPVHCISVDDHAQLARQMGAIGYLLKPASRAAVLEAIDKVEARASQGARRLLIVEDDLRERAALETLLGGEGTEIVSVAGVAEALAALEAAPFDCVVTDLALVDGSGFDLLEKMAADEALGGAPVIVHTGRDLDADEEARLRRISSSIVVKGARSAERLVDEVSLFLHQVDAQQPGVRKKMLEAVRSREAVFEGRRILIVEDDVRNVFALSRVLEPRGAQVVIARNGREALELLETQSVDAVLMDIMMPEMDGIEATRRIRARPAWKKLPIIALTAKAMADDRARCLEAGATDYLPKPIDVSMLLSLLRVWLPR